MKRQIDSNLCKNLAEQFSAVTVLILHYFCTPWAESFRILLFFFFYTAQYLESTRLEAWPRKPSVFKVFITHESARTYVFLRWNTVIECGGTRSIFTIISWKERNPANSLIVFLGYLMFYQTTPHQQCSCLVKILGALIQKWGKHIYLHSKLSLTSAALIYHSHQPLFWLYATIPA